MILSSPDGLTWKVRFSFPAVATMGTGAGFWGIASGNNRHVAVGGRQQATPPYTVFGDVFESMDSGVWNEVDGPVPGFLSDIAFGNGTFVAVGGDANGARIRVGMDNGWKRISNQVPLTSVAYGRGVFVAVGARGAIQSSADGLAWTNQISETTAPLNRVRWVNDRFMAVGDGGTILTSTNGSGWRVLESNHVFGFACAGVAFGNEIFVGVTGESVLTSSNGLSWSSYTMGTNLVLRQIVFAQNKFVMVGGQRIGEAGAGAVLLASTNGVDWQQPDFPTVADLSCVTFAKDRFVVGGAFGPIMTSPDGEAWSVPDARVFSRAVAYGNNAYLAVGGNRSWTSTDGVEWRPLESAAIPQIEEGGLAFGKGLFVAVPVNMDQIVTSSNGIDWQPRFRMEVEPYKSVTYVNGVFVAGGLGVIATSPDGATWTRPPAIFSDSLLGVAYGNSIFVGLTDGGEIEIAPLGILLRSWALSSNGAFHFEVFGGSEQDICIQASSDLKDWTTISRLSGAPSGALLDSTATNYPFRFYRANCAYP